MRLNDLLTLIADASLPPAVCIFSNSISQWCLDVSIWRGSINSPNLSTLQPFNLHGIPNFGLEGFNSSWSYLNYRRCDFSSVFVNLLMYDSWCECWVTKPNFLFMAHTILISTVSVYCTVDCTQHLKFEVIVPRIGASVLALKLWMIHNFLSLLQYQYFLSSLYDVFVP